jgi:hypothetical protein
MLIINIWSDSHLHTVPLVLLYVGPDVFLPLASALAALAGVALMFWTRVVGIVKKAWRVVTRRPE